MRRALALARRAYGATSPNPMVGAVLVKSGKIIGQGWHRRAGEPHAEIEALRDAERRKNSPKGATLYVTLEPCCTHGRTPPCTEAIKTAGIKRVVIAATDPNPKHAGEGLTILTKAGIEVVSFDGRARRSARAASSVATSNRRARSDAPYRQLANEATKLNEAFNHWIVQRTPFVTVKAAMTLDGKIATASGESKWITGEAARAEGMRLRAGADAILVGVNTVLADDPSLTVRTGAPNSGSARADLEIGAPKLRRIILDSQGWTPLTSKVVSDQFAALTTIVVGKEAPAKRVAALAKRVRVWTAPLRGGRIDLRWVLKKLGGENVTSLLVEGGGEVNASFLMSGHAQRVAFFYAPKILGGRDSRKAVAGEGARSLNEILNLREVEWRKVGADLMMTALVERPRRASRR
ncbi:MAG: bifunctional diaminohydroxyphosphoribosylaminopyrimidine deaminase/5-amino-6-(5-phosphoribosylamino)uracil reductase RibD [Verrucomicrobia bacterium]|nr:bifunctional diaminohydroxyphosphoribosylaminopyrimidine deaminase/5-amino-6-(5-phosphoribosylamino)uracil reductase RibD [Verrucomicrobiota bacterium]